MYALGRNEFGSPVESPLLYFSQPSTLVTADFLAEFKRHLVDTACKLAEDRTVYWVRPIPEMGRNVPKTIARRLVFGIKEDISISLADYRRRNEWVWDAQNEAAERCGVQILDPTTYLCDGERCFGSRDLQPYYSDDNHLGVKGSALVAPMFKSVAGSLPAQ